MDPYTTVASVCVYIYIYARVGLRPTKRSSLFFFTIPLCCSINTKPYTSLTRSKLFEATCSSSFHLLSPFLLHSPIGSQEATEVFRPKP